MIFLSNHWFLLGKINVYDVVRLATVKCTSIHNLYVQYHIQGKSEHYCKSVGNVFIFRKANKGILMV